MRYQRTVGGVRTACLLALALAAPTALAQKPPAGDEGPGPSDPGAPTAPAATAPAPAATAPAATAPAAGAAAPAAGAATPAAPAAPASAAPTTGQSYTVKLHDLETRVDRLKEDIFRSKARLNLLKETVLTQSIGGSRAIIIHRNEMSSTYTLIKLVYALDGSEIFAKSDDTGHLGDTQEIPIYEGPLAPGNHTISVQVVYQGNGYGVFSYLKGYQFKVNNSYTFTAADGKTTQLKCVGFEKGNPITTDPKDRPAIDFKVNISSDTGAAAPAAKK